MQGDFNSQDYKLKRVGNLDLHRTLPIHAKLKRFVENPDGSVKYYLNQNDSRKKDSGCLVYTSISKVVISVYLTVVRSKLL